ncbi:MAG TPA: four helix bundle protein [Anaerolineae bacterium]|nr:four helix bundle protein [Anaerolineae bacterium]
MHSGQHRRRFRDATIQSDLVRCLTIALASCDETKAHLGLLYECGSLSKERYRMLGAKTYNFREAVIRGHKT